MREIIHDMLEIGLLHLGLFQNFLLDLFKEVRRGGGHDLEAGGDCWYQAVLCIGMNEVRWGVVPLMWSDVVCLFGYPTSQM